MARVGAVPENFRRRGWQLLSIRQVGRVVEWVTEQGWRVDEVVKESKTDAEGEGAVVAITSHAMQDLDAIRQGADASASMFGLSASQIHRRLKPAAQAAGLGTASAAASAWQRG